MYTQKTLLVLNPINVGCFSLAVYPVSPLPPPLLPRALQIAKIKLLISYSAAAGYIDTKD